MHDRHIHEIGGQTPIVGDLRNRHPGFKIGGDVGNDIGRLFVGRLPVSPADRAKQATPVA